MVDAVANQPSPIYQSVNKLSRFKVADPQYVVSKDPATSTSEMEEALLQDIGGHEILSVMRRNVVDGTNIDYQIVSGLDKLAEEYNSKTIMSIEDSSYRYFNLFGIRFENYVPSQSALSLINTQLVNPVAIDANNSLTIYVSNIEDFYEVEVQSITSGELLRDTIYEGLQS